MNVTPAIEASSIDVSAEVVVFIFQFPIVPDMVGFFKSLTDIDILDVAVISEPSFCLVIVITCPFFDVLIAPFTPEFIVVDVPLISNPPGNVITILPSGGIAVAVLNTRFRVPTSPAKFFVNVDVDIDKLPACTDKLHNDASNNRKINVVV